MHFIFVIADSVFMEIFIAIKEKILTIVVILNSSVFTVNWVDHSKTLREQGIDETEILLLRRKYFFSDQNIDSTDPVQLGLLYVQVR